MSLYQLALDHADALTLVLTFLAPCDLSTCAALDQHIQDRQLAYTA